MVAKKKSEKKSWLVAIGTFFIDRWKAGVSVWLVLLLTGIVTYTSVITREGFPPISFPISVVSGPYLVNDADRVDSEVVNPISEAIKDIDGITDVEGVAASNFFSLVVSFDESFTSDEGTNLVRTSIEENVILPEQLTLDYSAVDPGGFLFEYDMLVQVYSTGSDSTEAIDAAAVSVATQLEELEIVERAVAQENISMSIDPSTGQPASLQTTFSRTGIPAEGTDGLAFYPATTVGVDRVAGEDIIELSDAIMAAISELDTSVLGDGIEVRISADFAVNIQSDISFLESNITSGLLAVALVSFLLITWRASIITALFMLTVMFATIFTLYLIGYTLNTITLFALILSLGLFVDDATIVVEALDVSKRNKKKKAVEVVGDAIRRVGRASLSGTLTTILVFAILAAPTGILGRFIRLIPITVIIALLLSFILSITVIPLLSRFIILKNREMSTITKMNPVLRFEEWLAERIEKRILSIRTMKGKLYGAGTILFSIILIQSGMYIFGTQVDNNTFPPAKDSDQIQAQLVYAPGTSFEQAEAAAAEVESIVNNELGEYLVQANYGPFEGLPTDRSASVVFDLTPFTDRDVTSQEMIADLQAVFDERTDIGARLVASQIDNGPPASEYPFGIRVFSEDTAVIESATQKLSDELVGQVLESPQGVEINILDSQFSGVTEDVLREDGRRYGIVRFAYDSDNPTLVTLETQARFEELFAEDAQEAEFGVAPEDLVYDAGQEGDFQDSFATLVIAVPVSLLLMYILLVIQFRSFIQPGLILLAIPFTLFGVAYGLWVTNNAASFFALTGFIGLIGIAVNNTIMLTDYANQERRAGKGPIEAIAAASRKRFRPLLATSITTVVALLPLALSDPFWEALAFTIIFGLLSSTFLVILAFPYYYLLVEAIRRKVVRLFKRS